MTTRAISSRPFGRSSPLLLLASAVVLGFGLGKMGLVLSLPAPDPAGLAALRPVATATEQTAAPETTLSDWAPAFGQARPAPAAAEDEPEAEPPPPEVELAAEYRLKGMITRSDAGANDDPDGDSAGGWALIDDGADELLVRIGDTLPGEQTVVAIGFDGVRLEGPAGPRLIAFGNDRDESGEEEGDYSDNGLEGGLGGDSSDAFDDQGDSDDWNDSGPDDWEEDPDDWDDWDD